jgi:hypothetical protein
MKRNIFLGLALGFVAGILDCIPMIAQEMPWAAVWGAFSLWIVVGFMVATSNLALRPILKGMIIALLCLIPSLIIIVWDAPVSIIPIVIITLILGGLIGWGYHFLQGRNLGIAQSAA